MECGGGGERIGCLDVCAQACVDMMMEEKCGVWVGALPFAPGNSCSYGTGEFEPGGEPTEALDACCCLASTARLVDR